MYNPNTPDICVRNDYVDYYYEDEKGHKYMLNECSG